MHDNQPAVTPANECPIPEDLGMIYVLSPAELARRWNCCRQTIYNAIKAGELSSFKVRNSRLILISEVERIERGES